MLFPPLEYVELP